MVVPVPRLDGVVHRLLHVVPLNEVVGQRAVVLLKACPEPRRRAALVHLLYGLAHAQMVAALADGADALVQDIAHLVVGEGVGLLAHAGPGHHHPGRERLLHGVQQGLLLRLRDPVKQVQRKLPADDRRHGQHAAGLL